MLKARRIAGALSGLLPKQEFLLKVRKRVWRVALVLGMLLFMCPVLFSPSMYTSGFSASDFTYTGSYMWVDDGNNNLRIKYLTSGVFTPKKNIIVDVFLVGGGGGGASITNATAGAGGGGGGYTGTWMSVTLNANQAYSVVIGAGGTSASNGGSTSGFGYSVNGGSSGTGTVYGGAGGSGGGGGANSSYAGGAGGTNGSNGTNANNYYGGTGQGTTTKEFGETSGTLYSGGGGGGANLTVGSGAGGAGGGANGGAANAAGSSASANTGGGGGGSGRYMSGTMLGGSGGSGICIIRNHR